jgi:hypothetical protein
MNKELRFSLYATPQGNVKADVIVKDETLWRKLHNRRTRSEQQNPREMSGKRGIKPEELPPAEDIKKMERRVTTDEKKIEQSAKKPPKNE